MPGRDGGARTGIANHDLMIPRIVRTGFGGKEISVAGTGPDRPLLCLAGGDRCVPFDGQAPFAFRKIRKCEQVDSGYPEAGKDDR